MEYDRTHCFSCPACRVMSRSHPVAGSTAFPQLSCKTLLSDTHGFTSPFCNHIPRRICGTQGVQYNCSGGHCEDGRLYSVDFGAAGPRQCGRPAECIPKKNRHSKLHVVLFFAHTFSHPHLCVPGSPFASVFRFFTTRGGRGCRVSILFRYTLFGHELATALLPCDEFAYYYSAS